MKDVTFELKRMLIESVQRNPASSSLFSGGLDSAILASINPSIKAITVSLKSYGEDIEYADSVARFLNIEHYQKSVDVDEAMDSIPEVIRILRTFDLAIPNDIVVYFGLKQVREMGFKEVMTGDGGDELLGGYSFMQNLDNLDDYIKRISSSLKFSSNELGEFFTIGIKQPYLAKEVIDFCLKITKELKIRQEDNRVWGKWILRKAFKDVLPKEVVWQDKRPLEHGSGMSRLREIITSRISDEEFREKSRLYPVKFMNKEHLYYYEIYREEIGEVPNVKEGQKKCPGCGTGMKKEAFHCRVCGWVEVI